MRQGLRGVCARSAWHTVLAGVVLAGSTVSGGLPAFASDQDSGQNLGLPEVSFAQSAYSAMEGAAITFDVTKWGPGQAVIEYETYTGGVDSGGVLEPATPGDDYTSTSGTLRFPDEDADLTITVQTSADSDVNESHEMFGLLLRVVDDSTGAPTAKLGIPSTAIGVILNCSSQC